MASRGWKGLTEHHLQTEEIDNVNFGQYNLGESNGKLPLRTCPGCSIPEPYQSPD